MLFLRPLNRQAQDILLIKAAVVPSDLARDLAVLHDVDPVGDAEQLRQAQLAVRQVRVHEDLLRYIGALCEKTRSLDDVLLGVSPRAALALMRVSQACAAMDGRDYVTPEDIKRMAIPALAHRMILRTAYGQRSRAAEAVQQALDAVPVPTEKTDR